MLGFWILRIEPGGCGASLRLQQRPRAVLVWGAPNFPLADFRLLNQYEEGIH